AGHQHIELKSGFKPGDAVGRNQAFAQTAAPATTPNCEHSDLLHVHFAFLRGTGTTGSYETMIGVALCGRLVTISAPTQMAKNGGTIVGLAPAPGAPFPVPACPA